MAPGPPRTGRRRSSRTWSLQPMTGPGAWAGPGFHRPRRPKGGSTRCGPSAWAWIPVFRAKRSRCCSGASNRRPSTRARAETRQTDLGRSSARGQRKGAGPVGEAIWETHRKAIETAVLDDAPEVTLLVDLEAGCIEGVRGPCDRLLGRPARDLEGKRVDTLQPRDLPARRLMAFGLGLLRSTGYYGEVAVAGPEGEYRVVAVRTVPLELAPGRPGALVRLLDVAEQVRLSEALREAHTALQASYRRLAEQSQRLDQARRAASLSTFAAGLAHELNNPAAFATSCARTLREYLEDIAKAWPEGSPRPVELQEGDEIVQDILDGLGRVTHIVSRLRELELRPNPHEFDLAAMLRGRFGDEAQVEVAPRLDVHTDPGAIERALAPLVENARWAGGEKGTIRMVVTRDGDRIRIAVEDEGPGVPSALVDRVFDPFFTTRPPGEAVGLGLFLARRAIGLVGGEISVDESYEGGARFVVSFPLVMRVATPDDSSYEAWRTG
ncbi:MAG: PAS domain-containing sensor histidine kinase [Deltaproteobacteria bacterium]|nr:MAG: PAS domain-containing sensor histidine kinase [Deltaproteobacteria bacterium]